MEKNKLLNLQPIKNTFLKWIRAVFAKRINILKIYSRNQCFLLFNNQIENNSFSLYTNAYLYSTYFHPYTHYKLLYSERKLALSTPRNLRKIVLFRKVTIATATDSDKAEKKTEKNLCRLIEMCNTEWFPNSFITSWIMLYG